MRVPESRERDEQELLLQAALIAPLAANEGHASSEVERAASRGVELGGRIRADSPAQLQAVSARRWMALVHMDRGELRSALALSEETLDLAEHLADPLLLSNVHQLLGELRSHWPTSQRRAGIWNEVWRFTIPRVTAQRWRVTVRIAARLATLCWVASSGLLDFRMRRFGI
jgi:hypothetical protein